MNVWVEGIQNALEYIEQNLTEEISVKTVAEKAHVSEFHFQRISMLYAVVRWGNISETEDLLWPHRSCLAGM